MPAILQEVPAFVQHTDHVRNAVQVKGGKNWDLSRSALETPITQLVDPEPVPVEPAAASAPSYAPTAVSVPFARNSQVVPQSGVKALKSLKGLESVTVTGHADKSEKTPKKLAKLRADAVAKRLRSAGVDTQVRTADLAPSSSVANRRVDVTVDELQVELDLLK